MTAENTIRKIPEMNVTKCMLPGLLLIERNSSVDERGFFREVFRRNKLGREFDCVQMNHSLTDTGYVRGIHGEKWDKLVYPLTGKSFSAIVDLRVDSPTFGKHEDFIFDCVSKPPHKALFIPSGLGNSVCAIEGPVNYIYLVSDYWTPDSSFAINPLDPDLDIHWPVEELKMDNKDKGAPLLRDRFPEKF